MADITILISDQKEVGGEWEVEVSATGDTSISGTPSAAQCLAENMMRFAEEELRQQDEGGFIRERDIPGLIAHNQLLPVLVRLGGGRFTCAVQDVTHLIEMVEASGLDYVRDISLAVG